MNAQSEHIKVKGGDKGPQRKRILRLVRNIERKMSEKTAHKTTKVSNSAKKAENRKLRYENFTRIKYSCDLFYFNLVILTSILNVRSTRPLRQKKLIKVPRKLKRSVMEGFQLEADESVIDSEGNSVPEPEQMETNFVLDSLKKFVMTVLPVSYHGTLLCTNLISSLTGFFLSIYQVVKTKSKISVAILVSISINLISTILMMCDVEPEVVNEVIGALADNPELLTEPELEPYLRAPTHLPGMDIGTPNRDEKFFLEKFIEGGDFSRAGIRKLTSVFYDRFLPEPILAEPRGPSREALGPYAFMFAYPDWFLMICWNCTHSDMITWRKHHTRLEKSKKDEEASGTTFYDRFKELNKKIEEQKNDPSYVYVFPPKHDPDWCYNPKNGKLMVGINPWDESTYDDDHYTDEPIGVDYHPTEQEIEEFEQLTYDRVEAHLASMRRRVEEAGIRKRINPADMVPEMEIDWSKMLPILMNIGKRIVCILIYVFDCVIVGHKFSLAKLVGTFRLVEIFNKEESTISDIYAKITDQPTPKQAIVNRAGEYQTHFNEFMEQPVFEFAKNPHLIYDMRDEVRQFEQWYSGLDRESKTDIQSVHALYTVTNARIHQYFQQDIKNMARHEPFLILLQGEGGIGKTKLAQHLAVKICQDILYCDPNKNIAEITSSDKYWPPLGGQSVAIFDDVGSTQDFKEDLLFHNLKGICSPIMFNAAGADLMHKVNPINFKVIIATTNTSFENMATRIANMFDAESIGPYARRMMCIKCSWNTVYGKHYPEAPWKNTFDHEGFSHLKLEKWKFEKKFVMEKPTMIDGIMAESKERYTHYAKDFANWIAKMRIAGEQQREHSRTHFSIILHGPAGQGKTHASTELIENLSLALNLPAYFANSIQELRKLKIKGRGIFLLDDLIRTTMSNEEENLMMDFYNGRAQDGSIILWTSNVSPTWDYPYYSGGSLAAQRSINFSNVGLARRCGFGGFFNGAQMPQTGMEFYVENMKYWRYVGNNFLSIDDLAYYVPLWWKYLISVPVMLYLLPPILSILIIAGITAAFIRFYLVVKWEEIEYKNLMQTVFQEYNNFLKIQNKIEVVYTGTIEHREDYGMMIDCVDSRQFMQVSTPLELEKHLFFYKTAFHESNIDWKIYCDMKVFHEMRKNVARYVLKTYDFDEESVIAMIKRYAVAFNAVGIRPNIYAKFHDIGTFQYVEGKLFIAPVGNPDEFNTDKVPRYIEAFGVFNVFFGEHRLTQLECLELPAEKIFEMGLTNKEALTLQRYLNSDEFRLKPAVVKFVKQRAIQHTQLAVLQRVKFIKDSFSRFAKHPLGIVAIVIFSVFTIGLVTIGFVKLFTKSSSLEQERKRGKKKGTKKDIGARTDSEDEDKEPQRKRGKKKGTKKDIGARTDSEDDHHDLERKRGKKKGTQKNIGARTSGDEDYKQEDVLTKPDVNDFVALKPYYEIAFQRARENMCIVYASARKEDEAVSEIGVAACYGIFLFEQCFVTVGHVVDEVTCIRVGADQFKDYHKAHLLLRYGKRDLSVWYVPTLVGKYSAKDLSQHFIEEKKFDPDDEWNAVFQRFAPNKKEEFHSSMYWFNQGPTVFPGNGSLVKWGVAQFAVTGVKVSAPGDCGLPYYLAERHPLLANKILGVHCMGNKEGCDTSGIIAIIMKEDVNSWKKDFKDKIKSFYKKQNQCCEFGLGQTILKDDDKPKCMNHMNVWHKNHTASWSTMEEEINFYLKEHPKFIGGIYKHAGSLFGTVKHSHTQFLPNVDVVDTDVGPWRLIDLDEETKKKEFKDQKGHQITVDVPERTLYSWIKKNVQSHGIDFRVRADRYPTREGYRWKMCVILPFNEEFQVAAERETKFADLIGMQEENIESDTLVAFPSHYGDPVYVHPAVNTILVNARRNKERGKLEDVPYNTVIDNETVKVIGSFAQSKSHIPNNKYQKSPFSELVKDLIPIEKMPVVYDQTLVPDEAKAQMVINRYGQPCPRATLSLSWAHRIYGDHSTLRRISKEFDFKIKKYYSKLRILTDEEVLAGVSGKSPVDPKPILGMELDSSIGYTMKELFYVSKKSDVIGVTEEGKYYWHDNAAAHFLKAMFNEAKKLSTQGKKYIAIFTELLKCEKLKIAKMYKGRTFVAQDILGVMMERRNLGMLCARAQTKDPNCGIGCDAVKDFNRFYERLARHPNLWAGDYKNFDRNTPGLVQTEITRLLAENNKHMANEIWSTMRTNIERIQVSGNTLSEIFGGMPSGCFTTAALNSLNNEYLMFASFFLLCEERNMESTWELYEDNIERLYYGDDVIISVSDKYKNLFTRENVARILKEYFGMVLDSSAKDGSNAVFDTFESASWISRFFRQVGRYEYFHAGALKKISIGGNFHYVSSVSLEHLGSLMERALWEASFWDDEYFDTIYQAVQRCLDKQPKLWKYCQLRNKSTLNDIAHEMAIPSMFFPIKQGQQQPVCKVAAIEQGASQDKTEKLKVEPRFFNKYVLNREYFDKIAHTILSKQFKMSTTKSETTLIGLHGSYSQKLNDLFTQGEITKPVISYTSTGPDNLKEWVCTIQTIYRNTQVTGTGKGGKKAEAKEGAAYEVLQQIGATKKLALKTNTESFQKEMGNQINGHYLDCVWSNPSCSVGPDTCNCFYRKRDQRRAEEAQQSVDELTDDLDKYLNFLENGEDPVFKLFQLAHKNHDEISVEYSSEYTFGIKIWQCKLTIEDSGEKYLGIGDTKKRAMKRAAEEALFDYTRPKLLTQTRRPFDPSGYDTEMNVSAGTVGKVPSAPMAATDVSVVADSGLYTNTQAPSPAKIINSLGIALDNPAGTGAPFDKKTSVYNIYQRWTAKNTTISPAMASGTEVLRISLDPNTLPDMIKDYISFHRTCIPAIEVVIAIAGAQGTIGWITTGWVRDASKKTITLDELQQVSMEESNMNGTQVMKILLTDVRKNGLYRNVQDDAEPYPGIIMMIDHAVTNVQRNDGVNYPVRVQVKLHPSCVLMEPFERVGTTPTTASFNLGSYFYDDNVDMLVGTSAVTEDLTTTEQSDDDGFNTQNFSPKLTKNNVACVVFNTMKSGDKGIPVISSTSTIDATYLSQISTLTIADGTTNQGLMPSKIYLSYGKTAPFEQRYYYNTEPTVIGSVYKITGTVRVGIFKYTLDSMIVQAEGCFLVLTPDVTVQEATVNSKSTNLVIYNGTSDSSIIDSDVNILSLPDTVNRTIIKVPWVSQDKSHDRVAIGDDLDVMRPQETGNPDGAQYDIKWVYNDADVKIVFPLTQTLTGNSMPAQTLPTGLKQLSFIRIGTTTTVSGDTPFVPLYKPILKNAYDALDTLIKRNNLGTTIAADLVVNSQQIGQICYQNRTFLVRTDSYKRIYPRVGNDVFLENITTISSPQGLAVFNTTAFSDWISTGLRTTRRRLDLSQFQREMMALAGGAISGIGSGLTSWSDQMFRENMLNKVLANNQALQGANNAAIAQRQKDAFERNIQLTGYNSASSQFGLIGPRDENHMNTRPYQDMSNFVYSHTFTNGSRPTRPAPGIPQPERPQQPDTHSVTSFEDNPAFEPAPRNTPVDDHTAHDVLPIDAALDKETSNQATAVVHQQPDSDIIKQSSES